jgi:hypothetical protein
VSAVVEEDILDFQGDAKDIVEGLMQLMTYLIMVKYRMPEIYFPG